ncbi:hypothetical protein HYT25_00375 [Candidatus Pacearchaeota archaeon]|nr:hypothetical protein [Candidatus Pacearchaeota archaeon]
MKNNETSMWILIAIIIVLFFSGFGMMGFGGSMMGWMFGYNYGFMSFFGWAYMVLITVTLVLLIVWLIKQIQNPRRK